MTAVEWLIEKHFGGIENCTPDFRNKIEQAKEMEKQQIIDAWCQNAWVGNEPIKKKAEQYYNEQFKNK